MLASYFRLALAVLECCPEEQAGLVVGFLFRRKTEVKV
jgi:hypothetical protein